MNLNIGSATKDGFVNLPMQYSTYDARNVVFDVPGYQLYWWWRGQLYRNIVGAKSDLASTPRIQWNVIPPFGWYAPAACAHDFLYGALAEVQQPDGSWLRIQMPFDQCNVVIEDLMTSLQTSPLQDGEKVLIYRAVSEFGTGSFSDDLAKPIVMPPKSP